MSVVRPEVARALVRILSGLGIAAGAALFVLKAPGPLDLRMHAFAAWLLLPWLVTLLLAWRGRLPRGLLAGAVLAALFEGLAYWTTFVRPTGSTAALIYAVKPAWQLGLVGAALLAGAITGRRCAAPPATKTGRESP